MAKPLIVITNDSNQSRHDGASRRVELPKYYAAAVAEAGGIPVMTMEYCSRELIALADGLLISGGDDLEPELFGEASIGAPLHPDPVRTGFELPMIREYLTTGKPALAICRGIQAANVVLGGSLWQDLPAQLGLDHSGDGLRHWVRTEPGSLLRRLFGQRFRVNSTHHQAVRSPAPGFRVTAWSEDGVAEAAEHDTLPLWAVQFHPERLSGGARPAGEAAPDFLPLFQYFIHQCGEGSR